MNTPIVRNANSGAAKTGRTRRSGPFGNAQIFTNFVRTGNPRPVVRAAPLLQVPAKDSAYTALHAETEEHNRS